jgi:hypothetical protein
MSQGSFKTAELEALTNPQVVTDNVVQSVVSDQVGKTVSHPVGTGNGETVTGLSSSKSLAPVAQNRGLSSSLAPLDLTRPVKTEGEASPGMSTVSQPPPTDGVSMLPASQSLPTPLSGSAGSLAGSGDASSSSSPSSSALPVNVTSISNTLGAFGSPLTALGTQLNLTAEEQLAAYKKANIIALSALAKKGGPNARDMLAVQAKLQEFLTNLIALAGNSGQQLKSTVQMLVQQLVTGSISEQEFAMRIEKDLHSQHQPSLLPFLQNSVPHLRTRLQLQQAIMKELLQRQAQEKLQQKKLARPGAVPETTSTSNSVHTGVSLGKTTSVNIAGPASLSGSPGEQQPLNQHQKMNSTSVSVSPSTAPSATTSSSSSTASVPLPISTMSLTAQLREHLAKLTPQQQRAFYMQQLTTQSQRLPQNQQSQTSQQAQSSQQRVVVGAVSQQQAQVVSNARLSVSPLNSHTTSALSTGKVSVGGVAVKQISSRLPVTSSVSANHLAAGKVAVGSPSKGGGIRSGFVDVKLAPAAAKLSSPPSSAAGKGKGKVKLEKNVADDEEEEDDEMDFSGVKTVNLQAESMLPSSLGDTMRTVRDQAFFDVQALKRRVLPIARRCGISDITDGYLVLLSHGIQERLKDVLEKVTIVSQHRTESLKVIIVH